MAKVFYNLKARFCKIFQKDRKGAILLEFAFSVPVLITCLYYAIDIPQAFRISNKAYLISELYAQCVVNLVESRADKEINTGDLKNLSKLMGCCITGGANNVDLKGVKIVIDLKGVIFQRSSDGDYFWCRLVTNKYEAISEWRNKKTIEWYGMEGWTQQVMSCFRTGYMIIGIYDPYNRPSILYGSYRYSRKDVTGSYEISTNAQKQLVINATEENNAGGDYQGKLTISTSIKSDKLFYMVPLKSIGKQKNVTVSLPEVVKLWR